MAAGMRAVLEVADLIDLVVEVRDARMPRSTAVARLHQSLKHKPVVIVLNRSDLAEPAATRNWIDSLRKADGPAYAVVATRAATLRDVRKDVLGRPRKRGTLRTAVVGAPNVGKSSVINALSRRKTALTEDRPGVTRHTRWLKLERGVELLDTPGLLAPRIDDAEAAWQLALCGSIPDAAYDLEEAVHRFRLWCRENRPQFEIAADLDAFAAKHGMRTAGGEFDRLNAARKFVSLFRAGRMIRVTFERPEKGM